MGTIARSDVELVEASRRGEHEAFGHLVARYQDVICAVSYSSTRDAGLSEDVAQETFIAAWRQLGALRDTARLRPWLCGIARNLSRKARKRLRREELVDGDEHVAAAASPFDAAARGEVEAVVREALSRIPEVYREVLVLYYRENQSIREIAETLGTSEDAVMQRMSRGRRYLADSVSALVERSLRGERRHRDLVAAVLASITALALPSRVDASPVKGSTMLKLAIAATAAAAVGTTLYLVTGDPTPAPPAATVAARPALQLGAGRLGLAHAPTLGPTAAPRAIRSRSTAESDLTLLPADADAVIGVNFAQLRGSVLWQRFIVPQLGNLSGVHEIEALCGFDPMASLTSVSIGIKGMDEHASLSGAIVVHGFDKTKSLACFDKHGLPDAEKAGAKVTVDGDVILVAHPDGGPAVGLTFLDPTTALIVIGQAAATRQGVLDIANHKDTASASTAFADALQNINTDDSVWLMCNEHSSMVQHANTAIAKVTPTRAQVDRVYLSLNATDSLALDAGIRLGSPDTVTKLVGDIQDHIAKSDLATKLKQYFDQLDVFADGRDLIISTAISGDQIMALAAAVAMNHHLTH